MPAPSTTLLSQLLGEERTLLALEARLAQLTDQTRWKGQQVPIAPRAFAEGELIHTNDLRVHLGGDWWVEMTAKQAASFVGRKREVIQTRIRLLQAQLIESSLPTSSLLQQSVPSSPPGLLHPSSSSSTLSASTSSLPSDKFPSTPTPPTPSPQPTSSITPTLASSEPPPYSSSKPLPLGQTRTLKDEAGRDMTNDQGLPIIEIIEQPPLSPTSSTKRKAPPPISLASRRTEKQRGEARKRAFEEAEREERVALEKERKKAKILERKKKTDEEGKKGEMKRLKGEDGKGILDDQGLPLIEIIEPVDDFPLPRAIASSSSLAELPPLRSTSEREATLRQILADAEEDERSLDPLPAPVVASKPAKQLVSNPPPPILEPNGLAALDDPLKLVEALLQSEEAKATVGGPVVPVNGSHEILSEDNLPISRIQEPVIASPTTTTSSTSLHPFFSPSTPVPPHAPAPLPPSAQTPLKVKLSIFEKLEAEEKEMERRERLGLPPLVVEEPIAEEEEDEGEDIGWGEDEEDILSSLSSSSSKGKGKVRASFVEQDEDQEDSTTRPAPPSSSSPRPKKSISWSETDQVKEFLASESPSAPSHSTPSSETQPTAALVVPREPSAPAPIASGSTMKLKVVERAPVAPKKEGGKGGLKIGGAKEGGKSGWVKPVIGDEAMEYYKSLEEKKKKGVEAAAAASSQSTSFPTSPAPIPVEEEKKDVPVPIVRPTPSSTFIPPSVPSIPSTQPTAPIPASKPPILVASVELLPSHHEEEEDDEEEDDDSNSDASFQFSDVDSDAEIGEEGRVGAGLDMDEKMQMREAAVEYYRLRGVLQGRGGLSGAGSGTGDLEDRSEFVPLNATVSQSLDSTTLSLPTGPLHSNSTSSASSRFKSSLLTPSEAASVSLPTLVPGGGATGAFAGAIRVGKLENGKLIVGRVGPDGEELSDEDSSDGEEEEDEDGVEEAGREALMWGMVGGVVVQEEDLEKGGEELLKRVKGELGIEEDTEVELAPPAPVVSRMDFYQAEKTLTVSVYEKGLIPADVRVEFEERQVVIHLPTKSIPISPLYASINSTLSSFRVSPVKIELLLMKMQPGLRWNSITTNPPPPPPATTSNSKSLSSFKAQHFDASSSSSNPPPTLISAPTAISSAAALDTPTFEGSESSLPPPAPAKVSRFKARQAGLKASTSNPSPAFAPAPSPSDPILTTPPPPVEETQLKPPLSTVTERVPPSPLSSTEDASKKVKEPEKVVEEEQEVEEQPKKRVSRFKAERMKA